MTTPETLCTCGHREDEHSRLAGCLGGSLPCTCLRFAAAVAPTPTREVAQAQTDAAIAQVQENADPEFQRAARIALEALAASATTFTVDDVWDVLAELRQAAPREPRTLGPVMKRAVRDGLIVAMGYAPSRRRHQSPVRVYTGRP